MSSHPASKSSQPGPQVREPILGSRSGQLVGLEASGAPLVDFPGNSSGPVPARLAVALEPRGLQEAVARRQKVVLLFENGDPALPFIMGLIHEPSPTPLLDALLETAEPAPPPTEAHVDGKRVVIEGQDEVVLKCGEASITLRRNGKVIIKGTYLESRATGTHRIKGGSVEIN
ncbi:hypothetical protein HUA74_06010 [Myxococcus sp. CA051A]|uniref:DUF6484 domain-containing protein n=1 Tax=unclassified Myxococcus TaxID=2648731 RepID=UPI00157A8C4C|nr:MULTISPECIES: DUF6484 domain-containing protein [unclassified Myxococcus]NTX37173.1 hypothetical protein [Myxococcus sp. CA033]NTX52107.1 hypothetical protein [Myxococcus sp. CA039A]NTX60209.1 hypothetical protein [Myxococcus sp. CA051A]